MYIHQWLWFAWEFPLHSLHFTWNGERFRDISPTPTLGRLSQSHFIAPHHPLVSLPLQFPFSVGALFPFAVSSSCWHIQYAKYIEGCRNRKILWPTRRQWPWRLDCISRDHRLWFYLWNAYDRDLQEDRKYIVVSLNYRVGPFSIFSEWPNPSPALRLSLTVLWCHSPPSTWLNGVSEKLTRTSLYKLDYHDSGGLLLLPHRRLIYFYTHHMKTLFYEQAILMANYFDECRQSLPAHIAAVRLSSDPSCTSSDPACTSSDPSCTSSDPI